MLGSGGMGDVYLARDLTLERDVAIKFLPADEGDRDDTRQRLLREAQASASLDHPSICPVYEVGDAPDGRRPKATLHWVSAAHAIDCEVRLYDRLFTKEAPEEDEDFLVNINPRSLEVITTARVRSVEVQQKSTISSAKPPDVAAAWLSEMIEAFSGEAVLKQSSWLTGRLGETIASPLVTLVDDAGNAVRPLLVTVKVMVPL